MADPAKEAMADRAIQGKAGYHFVRTRTNNYSGKQPRTLCFLPALLATRIRWPLIEEKQFNEEREMEPKESDEIHMEFLMDKWYEQVLIYSVIENAAKPGRHLGWEVTDIVAFDKEEQQFAPIMSQRITDKKQGQAKPRPSDATRPSATKIIPIQTGPELGSNNPGKAN